MIEAEPKIVTREGLSDGPIRVGIILEADRVKRVAISTLQFNLMVDDQQVAGPEQPCVIEWTHSGLVFKAADGSARSACQTQVLRCPDQQFPEPSLAISPVIAGRDFHWKKPIEARFPGTFAVAWKADGIQLVNELPFEEYLACVVASEMSASAPAEFVKAQAITARSWAVCFLHGKHPDENFDLCGDDDCQRYHGTTYATAESLSASISSAGQFLLNTAGQVIPGYYSKCCGGASETPEDCFGLSIPDLVAVLDCQSPTTLPDGEPWPSLLHDETAHFNCSGSKASLNGYLGGVDDKGSYFRWTQRESKLDLARYLNQKTDVDDAYCVLSIEPLRRGFSGRIHELRIHYQSTDGETREHTCSSQYDVRALMSASFLYSSAFSVEDEGEVLVLHGAGWGHGVGLCQMGACALALQGQSSQEILACYFPAAVVEQCY